MSEKQPSQRTNYPLVNVVVVLASIFGVAIFLHACRTSTFSEQQTRELIEHYNQFLSVDEFKGMQWHNGDVGCSYYSVKWAGEDVFNSHPHESAIRTRSLKTITYPAWKVSEINYKASWQQGPVDFKNPSHISGFGEVIDCNNRWGVREIFDAAETPDIWYVYIRRKLVIVSNSENTVRVLSSYIR